MQTNLWCRLADFLHVQCRKYRVIVCWLVVCLVIGAVLGIITLVVTKVSVSDINYHLVDGNILNATAIGVGMGSFVWQRILSLVIPVMVCLLLACISRFTAYAIFPVIMVHGYWIAVSLWWVFFYYSFPAILLLIFYAVWLLLVAGILIIGFVWAFQWGNIIRNSCSKQLDWWAICRGTLLIVAVAVVLGCFEYLVVWSVLGKIVYKAV